MKKQFLIPISLLLLATACAPKNFEHIDLAAKETAGAIGCESFESRTWNAVNKYLIEQKEIPSAREIKERLVIATKELKGPSGPLASKSIETLNTGVAEIFDILLNEAPQSEEVKNSDELLALLTALELGDETTNSRALLKKKIKKHFEKVSGQMRAVEVSCQVPDESLPADAEAGVDIPRLAGTALSLPVYGMRFSMATAYQSCQVLDESVMTRRTPDVDGIVVTGTHKDGVGKTREVASISTLLKTHPYYKNINTYEAKCLNPRSSPLIYDYGGKPYATTSLSSPLSFFKNAGSGTDALGVDCSGLVYTALSAAGLRMAPNKDNKATGVYGISARMYLEPEKNGLTCLQKIAVTPTETLRGGDVVAVSGHVLMVDSVGMDPFGLGSAKSEKDCSLVSSRNFDFIIAQSSPSKDGVGINRYQARDYLREISSMRAGLEKYAYYACLAKFNNKSYIPSLDTSVVRHKMTPDCLGVRLKLDQESCIQTCPQLKK